MKIIKGNIVDIKNRETYPAKVYIDKGRIYNIENTDEIYSIYLIPGFIDSHIHIESSLLIPSHFAAEAIKHGVLGAVADPHEIANVMGVDGVNFMIENGNKHPFNFWFGAPSCVPSTPLETSGAKIDVEAIELLLKRDDIYFLGEMMNYPGVIKKNKSVMGKLFAAKKNNKPIDGHAPGLSKKDLESYAASGISTDHECTTIEEAQEKISLGMKVLIREGSAARNFDTLHPLLLSNPDMIMFCSDDMPASTLLDGYLHKSITKAILLGYDVYDVIRAASLNVCEHYNLPLGMLQINDSADFLIVENLENLPILAAYLKGEKIYDVNETNEKQIEIEVENINRFECLPIKEIDITIKKSDNQIKVIECYCGDLSTKQLLINQLTENGNLISDTKNDILKIVAMSRYSEKELSAGFIKGIGIKNGAMATSISHDNHNIVAVGTNDKDIARAINRLIENKGGMVVVDNDIITELKLEIAGLMTNKTAKEVADLQLIIKEVVKNLGSTLEDPFLTLSFMSLIVIPSIKLSSKGLFDVDKFEFTSLFEE